MHSIAGYLNTVFSAEMVPMSFDECFVCSIIEFVIECGFGTRMFVINCLSFMMFSKAIVSDRSMFLI